MYIFNEWSEGYKSSKKVKTNEHANKVMKKERILSIDTDALFLPLTDASENKEIISITSDSTVVDIFI